VASFFFKILANVTVLYEEMEQQHIGEMMFTITSVKQSQLFFFVGTTLHYFFFLFGLVLLFLIIHKEYNKSTISLLVFFTLITTLFSSSAYFVFYLTSSVLLGLIFLRYWKNFKAKKTKKALLLALSFLTIMISHVIFIFVFANLQLYAVAETVQLFGFILLLLTFMSLLRKNEPKN
jgi:asparagine N-glycosylation enzyme membrane subunit Stt3